MAKLLRQPVKLALIQLATTANKSQNLSHARSKVLEASRSGAHIIVLPECFNSPYGTQYFSKYAETLLPSPPTEDQSPSYHALSALAAEAKAYLVGGSIPEYENEQQEILQYVSDIQSGGQASCNSQKGSYVSISIFPARSPLKNRKYCRPATR